MKKQIIFSVFFFIFIGFSVNNMLSSSSESEADIPKAIVLKGIGSSGELRSGAVSQNVITAYIEGDILMVSFSQSFGTETITIRVSNESGEILYESGVVVNQSMSVSIPLELDDSLNYVLEISSTNLYLYGEF